MACNNVINSATVGLSLGGQFVAYSTDATITISHSVREITNKDSEGWADYAEGLRNWEASQSAYVAQNGFNLAALYTTYIDTRTLFSCTFADNGNEAVETDAISGMPFAFSGNGWLTSIEISSPGTQDNVSFSASIQGCGPLTTA